ncbi:CD109 antigen-like [Pyxicephalus adspersus]|uniref:CD109 antigen-like n=1 Tax=Pyxicephalus adspersus TaxID=30357 RepID=UPI003B59BBD9
MFKPRLQILRHTVLLYMCLLTCSARPSYYITAPQYIIPGMNTTLAVHWFGEQYSEINVTAGIAARFNILGQAYKVFPNDSIGLLTIPAIPANSSLDNLLLLINGCVRGTSVFFEQKEIRALTKNMTMFIQTDKDIYGTGETVHIRVISVNRDLKPYNGDVDLEIKDPDNNIVQQWLKMKSDRGVVSTHFTLTSSPILGGWTIQAKSNGNVFFSSFSVKDYALTKFIVTLDAPLFYVVPKTLNLTGTVTAKYSSNKPLTGSVTITVKSFFDEDGFNETFKLSGSVNFSFPYTKIQNAFNWKGLKLTASVTDQVTGNIEETSSFISVTNSEYEINFIENHPAFNSGGNYTSKIQIQRIDKKALTEQERKEMVTVNIMFESKTVQELYEIPETGIITVKFPVTVSFYELLIMVQYQNATSRYSPDQLITQNPFVQLQTPASELKVGVPFEVQVDVQIQLQEIYYTVISKGLVVAAGKNKTTFTLTPEKSWAPTAEILVYLIDSDYANKQISKTLNIKGSLDHKIGLSWSKKTANPSEQVSLIATVKEPLSLLALCIADKSSTLFERQNDLTTSRVYKGLNTFDMGPPFNLTDGKVEKTHNYIPQSGRSIEMFPRQDESVSTWIWIETNTGSGLTSKLPFTVPDMSTTWVATAFVVSENLGLGVVEEPVELSIFKPFVVSLNMPNSIIRGEQFVLEVTLKNSLKENLQVLVTLEKNDAFNIIVPNFNNISMLVVAGQQNVKVPREDATTVLFPLEPRKLGNITVTVKATSKAASDVLTKFILVKAEGIKYSYTQSEMFNLVTSGNGTQTASKNFLFSLPSDIVQGSEEAFVTVVGDLLVPSINGLQSLIQMPYGCGEQNMINFAPNIYILQYLFATQNLTNNIETKSIDAMNYGYQKELLYKRSDGSFSAFGNADSSGSTWLSAFVLRCFLQARKFIYISPSVLEGITQWLVQYQDMATGVFAEPGRVIHKELQGGLDGPVTLTAYILTTLLQEENYRQLYGTNIRKAVQYIESKFDEGISTNYTLSVVAYALTLANSTKAEAALNKLNSMANTTGDLKFWSSTSATTINYLNPKTTDIETAAYALLAFNEQRRRSDALPVMKWLTQQRSSLGGYGSTQDTIMALQALCKFLEQFPTADTSITVFVTGPTVNTLKKFQITNGNLHLLQSQQIEVSRPFSVNVRAVGRGVAFVQVNVRYNRKPLSRRRRSTPVTEAFKLDVKVAENKNDINRLSVEICTSYQGAGNESGMALVDVGFLSGFTLKTEDVTKPQSLKLVEPKEDNVYLYLDSVTRDKLCISVPMVRFAKVAGSQDAVIKVYDYYSPEMTATRTYNSLTMSQISSCDFCGSNCSLCRSNVTVTSKPLASNAYKPAVFTLWLYVILQYYFL